MPDPWLPPFVHPPAPADAPPGVPPRSLRVRRAWTWSAVLGAAAVTYVPPMAVNGLPVVPHLDLPGLICSSAVAAGLCTLLPKVSYRRRDALLAFLPLLGLWLVGVAVWRLSSLPYRDWRPRDDERTRVRVVPGTPYYLLAPDQPERRPTLEPQA